MCTWACYQPEQYTLHQANLTRHTQVYPMPNVHSSLPITNQVLQTMRLLQVPVVTLSDCQLNEHCMNFIPQMCQAGGQERAAVVASLAHYTVYSHSSCSL
eukprot:7639-Heterococcus_DN1.PRE.1